MERWDGTGWAIQPSPNPAGSSPYLASVSCSTPSACTAVGYSYTDDPNTAGFAERWDGASWSIEPTPQPAGAASSNLTSVSCTSPNACTAVGHVASGGELEPLIERWDGAGWSIRPSPPAPSAPGSNGFTGNGLTAVSCPSATACTAVGSYNVAGGAVQTLVEEWDGTTWQLEPSANPAGSNDRLSGVSCTSPSACTAVGNDGFAERLDGGTWSPSRSPTPLAGRPTA